MYDSVGTGITTAPGSVCAVARGDERDRSASKLPLDQSGLSALSQCLPPRHEMARDDHSVTRTEKQFLLN